MPRPRKRRKVCCLPECCRFGPLDLSEQGDSAVRMTVDEYETVRLIDREGLTQEACAARMGIARTTVQGIYDGARKKLAESLVGGRVLLIGGGEYRLCDGEGRLCGTAGCRRTRADCAPGAGRPDETKNVREKGEKPC